MESGELVQNSEFTVPNLNVESDSPQNSPLFSSQSIITKKSKLTDYIYEFAIENEKIAENAMPGQFLHIKTSAEHILRRPISISNVSGSEVFLVVEVRGDGTKHLCEKSAGETFDVIGPLGKGFTFPDGNVLLAGGGIGVAPLLFAASTLVSDTTAILGFRNVRSLILTDKFRDFCDDVIISTDDGSYGVHGSVVDPLEKLLSESEFSAVLTCGPRPMMASVVQLCQSHGIPCRVSLEEYMACGVGACFVCACKTMVDGGEQMKRVCVDGPVFDGNKVVFT